MKTYHITIVYYVPVPRERVIDIEASNWHTAVRRAIEQTKIKGKRIDRLELTAIRY